jgi:hypothetical protein
MKFTATMPEDGSELTLEFALPKATIGQPLLPPTAMGKRLAAQLAPSLAAAVEPFLPAAKKAHTEIQRDSTGRIVGTVAHPATPAPAIRAQQVVRGLTPAIEAAYSGAVAREYATIRAATLNATAQATAQRALEVGQRLRRLEEQAPPTRDGEQR